MQEKVLSAVQSFNRGGRVAALRKINGIVLKSIVNLFSLL